MTGIDHFRPQRFQLREPMKGMLACQFLITAVGTVLLFSASWYFARAVFDDPFRIWRRQTVWVLLGAIGGFIVYRLPQRWIRQSVPALVWIALALNCLTYIPGVGYSSGGAQRWISLFGFTFQPSEFTRGVLVLYLARMLEKNRQRMGNFRDGLLPPLLVAAALILSVYFQNDFSTAAYLLLLAMMLFFAAGVSKAAVGISALSGLCAAAVMLAAKPYRLQRLYAWFRPEADPAGSGYQLLRARVALERGGFWGRGLGRGTVKRGGLPAAHSDFIIAAVGEEVGLIGIAGVMALFTVFALKGWAAAERAADPFSRWTIFGLVSAIYWQTLINFSVVSGILPATGIPLPLFSAGGSAAFMTLIAFGLIFNFAGRSQ